MSEAGANSALKSRLVETLHQAGFELVGFCRAEPPPHLDVYTRWVKQGLHAGMAYLATQRALERRADPAQILGGVRTILVVGMRYANPAGLPENSRAGAHGRVAAYACSADYHDVIVPMLEQAAAQIGEWLGRPAAWRAYTDTGPVLERDAASQAGLGWIGKNTCFISPQHGSYFLLGELLLDVEIDPDPPFRSDQCGACRRCIDACPTQCIRDDRTLDAGRCISYLTIENKVAVPHDLRPLMGGWVFGCDVCQQVCPWNIRFASGEGSPALAPRLELARPVLEDELGLTSAAFNLKFKGTPLLRAKRRGYLRNTAVALGNSGDLRAVPALKACMQNEPEALVRAHAAWALGQIGGEEARAALLEAQAGETAPDVIEEITIAIKKM